MADYFGPKWLSYDTYNKGEIDETDAPHFIRDLFSSMAPPTKAEVNPYEIKEEKKTETGDHSTDGEPKKDETSTTTSSRSISSGGSTTSETTTTTTAPSDGSTKSTAKTEAPTP
jgi:hypothetical protein